MQGALADVLAKRDTQRDKMPDSSDSSPVADNDMFMDSSVDQDAHVDDNQMIESENANEQPQYQDDYNETPEVVDNQDGEQEAPTDNGNTDPRLAEIEKQLASSQKQRSDDQSYFQHQINELRAENEALKAVKEEKPPVKELTDEEINDLYYENPAEAMRLMQAQAQPQVNQKLLIQEGVQRALHNDYDDVIGFVQKQATLNPQLEQEIMNSPDPAKVAYEKGLELRKALEIQTDPKKYEAELRAKIEAELTNKQPMPTRVGGVRSTAPNVGKASQNDHGKTTFDKMFGKHRR
jgi:hypothetical protein